MENNVEKYFAIARERYQILLNRRAGLPRPWSADPIFQREYFCNVFREDDRTTIWFRENIRNMLTHPRTLLLAITAFRWFNRIETWENILSEASVEDVFTYWDSAWIKQKITTACRAPYVTGAYIIKTPDGKDKVDGVLWCIDKFRENLGKGVFDKICGDPCKMQEACSILQWSPYLGNFMSWQICSDARETLLLANASDKDTWAQPGPGTARGLGRVFFNDPDKFGYGSKKDEADMLSWLMVLSAYSKQEKYWPQDWPDFSPVIHHAHVLCEVDKYFRAAEGGRMKRKYQ